MVILAGYRLAMRSAKPFAGWWLNRRTRRGKEVAERLSEREGIATERRTKGRLLWAHAASVGEATALRTVVARLLARHTDLTILLTTVTVTSANMVASWSQDRLIHQFVPLDHPDYVNRFIDYWQPTAAVWVESELWPNLLRELRRRQVPAILLNARMSPSSFRTWSFVPGTARRLLSVFSAILPASDDAARMFQRFAPDRLGAVGNLKLANPHPGMNEAALSSLRRAIGDRRVWIAASTHDGEEQLVLAAHNKLVGQFGDLLTIIVPRHPNRGDAIATMIATQGHTVVRRSNAALPDASTTIYLADTMGEMGTLYSVANVAFVGGSLVPVGGHNPIEPVMLGKPVVVGPHSFAFVDEVSFLLSEGGAKQIMTSEDLAPTVAELLADPIAQKRLERIGQRVRDTGAAIEDAAVAAVEELLPSSRSSAASVGAL